MFRIPLLAAFLTAVSMGRSAQALIIAGDESQSTSAPGNDFGFANVGYVADTTDGIPASGIYLGNGWMISAYHVVRDTAADGGFSFGSVMLDGVAYSVDPTSGVRLLNSNQTAADLALFRLTSIPSGLKSVTISASEPAIGTPVDLAGNGFERAAAETHWNIDNSTTPPTWTETPGAGDAQGFKWVFSQTIRWGTNNISQYSSAATEAYGTTDMLLTRFDAGISGEAQAAGGDSGGGVFFETGGNWQLGGIMIETDTYNGQPDNTSVYGTNTYAGDLSRYQSQIEKVIPEPSAGLLVASAAAGLLTGRRRKAHSRQLVN